MTDHKNIKNIIVTLKSSDNIKLYAYRPHLMKCKTVADMMTDNVSLNDGNEIFVPFTADAINEFLNFMVSEWNNRGDIYSVAKVADYLEYIPDDDELFDSLWTTTLDNKFPDEVDAMVNGKGLEKLAGVKWNTWKGICTFFDHRNSEEFIEFCRKHSEGLKNMSKNLHHTLSLDSEGRVYSFGYNE